MMKKKMNQTQKARFNVVVAMVVLLLVAGLGGGLGAQAARQVSPATAVAPTAGAVVPLDYVIGTEDVLGVLFWRDADMTGDVTVRPDGMITLPLLGDVLAAGLKPEALRDEIQKKASGKYLEDPAVTVVVRQINSRKVFITGLVTTPGAYPLTSPRTVIQLIALAGGLTEYADGKNITVMRSERGKTQSLKFNYSEVSRGKNLFQNVELKPGDTVVVP